MSQDDEEDLWFGRIEADEKRRGCFTKGTHYDLMSKSVKSHLVDFSRDPQGVAAEFGKTHQNCCFCGKEITDKRSLSVGYDPTCADKFSLPWG